jgi:hypothetical protein
MFHQCSELSVWEIGHYWHNVSPNSTNPKNLPVEIEKTLRTLAGSVSKGLYYRFPPNSIYCRIFSSSNLFIKAITRVLQIQLMRAYKLRQLDKTFLDSLTITRTALAKWCLKTETPLPDFWFPADDPLRKADSQALDDISKLSRNGALVLFPVSGENFIPMSAGENLAASSSDLDTSPELKKEIDKAISEIARKNAQTRYQSNYEIKRNFIRYYHEHNFKTKSQAAGHFYCTLSEQEKQELVPSLDSDIPGADAAEQKAVRTLMTALREYKNGDPSTWLEGFKL